MKMFVNQSGSCTLDLKKRDHSPVTPYSKLLDMDDDITDVTGMRCDPHRLAVNCKKILEKSQDVNEQTSKTVPICGISIRNSSMEISQKMVILCSAS